MARTGLIGRQKSNNLLKEMIIKRTPGPGDYPTAIAGLCLHRRDEVNHCDNCFHKPLVSLGVQGAKRAIVGSEEYSYNANQCLINCVDMPSTNIITQASKQKPFLVVSLEIDKHQIGLLAANIPPRAENKIYKGVAVASVDAEILDAFLRLVELLDKPEQITIMAPLIIREIYYRLLIGPMGEDLRSINTLGSQSNQVSQAISWLKDNYKQPFNVDELAGKVHMATSTFHRHFRQITSLSPLQFQKRLRLFEAQRLMLVENRDATNAGYEVGYESAAQFNREYKRMFGEPPHKSINAMR